MIVNTTNKRHKQKLKYVTESVIYSRYKFLLNGWMCQFCWEMRCFELLLSIFCRSARMTNEFDTVSVLLVLLTGWWLCYCLGIEFTIVQDSRGDWMRADRSRTPSGQPFRVLQAVLHLFRMTQDSVSETKMIELQSCQAIIEDKCPCLSFFTFLVLQRSQLDIFRWKKNEKTRNKRITCCNVKDNLTKSL